MYIVMVSAECAPMSKVGGLADVVHGLARELLLRKHQTEVILPMYDCMQYKRIQGLEKCYSNLRVPYFDHNIRCDVFAASVDQVSCFFIKPYSQENFFDRGVYYGQHDDDARFAFFSRAAMEFMYKSGRQPNVIHCHDWQTGAVPVLLYEIYQQLGMQRSRVCYTLHNLRHQGVTGTHILQLLGLGMHLNSADKLQDNAHPEAINLMKGGIVYANFSTTVSPRYAEEVKHTELGHGLQSTLHANAQKFGGVLNGIDYGVWNPEVDTHIPYRYCPQTVELKSTNQTALRERLSLQHASKPIVAVVSRLDPQKGVQLISHAIFYALANRAQFVLLGTGSDDDINDYFQALKVHFNNDPDCHLEIGYDEALAHLIYAGADMLLIPSAFEPCGLTQLIAMKYGTVPIVRAIGGLADTVFDANLSTLPYAQRTGYSFDEFDNAAMEHAMQRAIGLWHEYPEDFNQLRINAMLADHSWNRAGEQYLEIYHHIHE